MVVTDRQLLAFAGRTMRNYPLEGAEMALVEHESLKQLDANGSRLVKMMAREPEINHLLDGLQLSTLYGDLWIHLDYRPVPYVYRVVAALECVLSGRASTSGSVPGKPPNRLIRTAQDAEMVAAEWMTFLGFGAAHVTPPGADGGVDVVAERGVAQVKMEGLPTGRPVVQETHGAAVVESKAAVCFSLAGYTDEAVAWADKAGVALLRFDFQGVPEPVNSLARTP